ncbi:hypothetical protein ACGFX2_35115 [Streptomyces goshikiensis]|uniref:hypothetical protein n=1 Tax=Streptomyces goshikiensis TaxID=1942 RepID=UPI003716EF9D
MVKTQQLTGLAPRDPQHRRRLHAVRDDDRWGALNIVLVGVRPHARETARDLGPRNPGLRTAVYATSAWELAVLCVGCRGPLTKASLPSRNSGRPGCGSIPTRPAPATAARDAIVAGGQVVVWEEVSRWMAAGIAATRLRRSLKIGLTTLGLDETVEILAQHRDKQLRTGIIDAADRSWHFTLYFDATGTELLACGGVKREPPSKAGGQEPQP